MVMARVQPGQRGGARGRAGGVFRGNGASRLAVLGDRRPDVVSNWRRTWRGPSATWARRRLAVRGSDQERYQRGVGWLVGIDAAPVICVRTDDDAPPVELAAMVGLKYLFLEQRAPAAAKRTRSRSCSRRTQGDGVLAGRLGLRRAAEYLPADALLAGYASTREPCSSSRNSMRS